MIPQIILLLLAMIMVLCYSLGRLHQWMIEINRERKQAKRLPNWLIAGLEDSQAIDTDTLLWIRDALIIVENRLEDRRRLVGQIRRGDYDKEQPASRPQ